MVPELSDDAVNWTRMWIAVPKGPRAPWMPDTQKIALLISGSVQIVHFHLYFAVQYYCVVHKGEDKDDKEVQHGCTEVWWTLFT